ncbi:MAG: M24 family metallopeptidase, partial [bacterium]
FLFLDGKATVLTNEIEKDRLLEEELCGLPVEVDSIPWAAERVHLLKEYAGGRRVLTDLPVPNMPDLGPDFWKLTHELTEAEVRRYRFVGAATGRALQKTCKELKPGMEEFEIAARLAANCNAAGVLPVVILIAADERIRKFRHPLPTGKKFEKTAMLVVCGKKHGLIASCTRMVHAGDIPAELHELYGKCLLVDATLNISTKPGEKVGGIFQKAKDAYRSVGFDYEWEKHHQGGPTGYQTRYFLADEASGHIVVPNSAYAWNPSITGVKSEDTLLVGPDRNEFVTQASDWPTVELEAGDFSIERPDILVI